MGIMLRRVDALSAGVIPVMWNHPAPSNAFSQSIAPVFASAMADRSRS